jgi:hypothetical protein
MIKEIKFGNLSYLIKTFMLSKQKLFTNINELRPFYLIVSLLYII